LLSDPDSFFQTLQIGTVIHIVMEDRGAAIAVGEDVIEPTWDVEAWRAGHEESSAGRVVISQYACLIII